GEDRDTETQSGSPRLCREADRGTLDAARESASDVAARSRSSRPSPPQSWIHRDQSAGRWGGRRPRRASRPLRPPRHTPDHHRARGSGAVFALLPPENATGNFTKIVQRLPVKILIDPTTDPVLDRIRAGLSVEAT